LREIRLRIDEDRCRVCRHCLAAQVCKVRAIVRLDPDEPPVLDVSRCYDCRLPACLPLEAVSIARSLFCHHPSI
jgi:MinD superfamily P-loop ATPase